MINDNTSCALVRVDSKFGPMVVYTPVRFWKKGRVRLTEEYKVEKGVWKTILNETYDVFVDVGAAIGYHTRVAMMNEGCKSIIAVEPDHIRAGILRENIRLGHQWNPQAFPVTVVEQFVAEPGVRYMHSTRPGCMVRRGDKSMDGDGGSTVVSLDELMLDVHPTCKVLIKVDIEGNEEHLLRGAFDTVRRPGTRWIVEVHGRFGVTKDMVEELTPGLKWSVHRKNANRPQAHLISEWTL